MSAPSSSLFAACRFVISRQLTAATDAARISIRDSVVTAVVSNGGVVDNELDPAVTTHLVVPPVSVQSPTTAQPQPSSTTHKRRLADESSADSQAAPDELRARFSRRVNVVYPSFVTACIERRALLARQLDPDHALLAFDCSTLQEKERERATCYADRELLDVEQYEEQYGGTYDPDDDEQAREVLLRQQEAQQQGGEGEGEEEGGGADHCSAFPVSSLARRSNLQVGEVVRISFMEGPTQQRERRDQRARLNEQRQQPDGDTTVNTEDDGEGQAEDEGNERQGRDENDEQDVSNREADDNVDGAHKDAEVEQAEGEEEDEEDDSADWDELMTMADMFMPQEDSDLITESTDECDPDVQLCEKAFVRVVERVEAPPDSSHAISYVGIQLNRLTLVYGSTQYTRLKLEPRHIITITPLYELQDCEELHEEEPDTFHLPPLRLRASVRVGTSIKCIFLQESEEGVWGGERMWLSVVRVDRNAALRARGAALRKGSTRNQTDGSARYRALLENLPLSIAGLSMFDEVTVEPRHICQIGATRDLHW